MQISDEAKRTLIRLAVETVVYALLVIFYLFLILNFFEGTLVALFQTNLYFYGFLALSLMVAQGFLLEFLTSFLLDRLNL
jgi:hypothetical protein